MPTYLDVVTRVQDDNLNRTNFTTQVKRAIQTTIRTYERRRFWFNETATTIACVAGVETIAVPSNMMTHPDLLMITEGSNTTELVVQSFATIRRINVNMSRGLPTQYARRHDSFYLANVPDSAYPVPCYYLKKLAPLSADGDTNDWLSAAEDLIVYGASKIVWATTIRNLSAANACATMEREAYVALTGQVGQHTPSKLQPTRF